MKSIGIDARLAYKTGVGVYIRNLLKNLPLKKNFVYKVFSLSSDIQKLSLILDKRIQLIPADYKWHSITEQYFYYLLLSKHKLDLMHFTYFSYPILYTKPFITTIHDITQIFFKTGKASTHTNLFYKIKHMGYRITIKKIVSNSVAIITPTKAVKKHLLLQFGQKYFKKIYPIYEGVNFNLLSHNNTSTLHKIIKKPFIFRLGNYYPHKNIDRLITAFLKLNTNYQLVLAGPSDYFQQKIKEKYYNAIVNNHIIFIDDPHDYDITYLYKHSAALIQPSLMEGFGLPLIEAQYYNCPILASDIEVFHELLGNKIFYFDPYDINDIAKKIKIYLQTFKSRKIRVDNSILDKFSFEKMAKKTHLIYEKFI